IAALLRDLSERCNSRKLTLCRELTKQFETVVTMTAAEAPAWLAADPNRERGEFVVVVHGLALPAANADLARHDAALRALLDALPLKQAVALAAEVTGAPRNALYDRALALKAAAADR
ncbi:MAG: 16S rRNA (cytidine(1402)-2'-O)-methyltransferase, partial [Pseudomonadota bacterium]|nr:16S rRNA (cytidine(1402)-2'-O)-methyltransferase [Pseudomonadota bacterium]